MTVQLQRVLYTAEAMVDGGREGHGRTSDGRLEVDLSVPKEMSGDGGPGTNPEQLFAVGYAACFCVPRAVGGRSWPARSSCRMGRRGSGVNGRPQAVARKRDAQHPLHRGDGPVPCAARTRNTAAAKPPPSSLLTAQMRGLSLGIRVIGWPSQVHTALPVAVEHGSSVRLLSVTAARMPRER
jgi:hypothetical protein